MAITQHMEKARAAAAKSRRAMTDEHFVRLRAAVAHLPWFTTAEAQAACFLSPNGARAMLKRLAQDEKVICDSRGRWRVLDQ